MKNLTLRNPFPTINDSKSHEVETLILDQTVKAEDQESKPKEKVCKPRVSFCYSLCIQVKERTTLFQSVLRNTFLRRLISWSFA